MSGDSMISFVSAAAKEATMLHLLMHWFLVHPNPIHTYLVRPRPIHTYLVQPHPIHTYLHWL